MGMVMMMMKCSILECQGMWWLSNNENSLMIESLGQCMKGTI